MKTCHCHAHLYTTNVVYLYTLPVQITARAHARIGPIIVIPGLNSGRANCRKSTRMPSDIRRSSHTARWLLVIAIVIITSLLLGGRKLLVSSDPLPARVDAAVVLQGSITGEKVRIAGAMNLLQQGIADRVLLSVPQESYWGESIPPVAQGYLEKNYGPALSARVDFCETDASVDSTEAEARVLNHCIAEHPWHSIVVVTSDYHTRRAGMLWRRVVGDDPKLHITVHGVSDPEFQQPWWRHRKSAKTWVTEFSKLITESF